MRNGKSSCRSLICYPKRSTKKVSNFLYITVIHCSLREGRPNKGRSECSSPSPFISAWSDKLILSGNLSAQALHVTVCKNVTRLSDKRRTFISPRALQVKHFRLVDCVLGIVHSTDQAEHPPAFHIRKPPESRRPTESNVTACYPTVLEPIKICPTILHCSFDRVGALGFH